MSKRNRYPHLQIERAKGKVYYYVRMKEGGCRKRIRNFFGSPEFLQEYCDAIKLLSKDLNQKPLQRNTVSHSLNWLIKQYMTSSIWINELSDSTKKNRSRYLARMSDKCGDEPYTDITKERLQASKESLKNVPNSANDFVRAVRGLFKWAYDAGYIQLNPAESLSKFKTKTFGHEKWTQEEVDLFRQSFPIGTKERIAFELLIHTGLRRSDVCKLGRQHLKDGILTIRCQKNKELVYIPVNSELSAAINSIEGNNLTFVSHSDGRPYTKESFGNFFGETCRSIGISKTAHGLRKYLATEIAQSGGSERELKALFGWRNSKEAETYTREADKILLSKNALKKLRDGTNRD